MSLTMPSGRDFCAWGSALCVCSNLGKPTQQGQNGHLSASWVPSCQPTAPQQTSPSSPDPFWPCPLPEPVTRGGYSEQRRLGHRSRRLFSQRKMKALLPDEGNRGWVSRSRRASPRGLYPASWFAPHLCPVIFDKSRPLLILCFLIWKMEMIP